MIDATQDVLSVSAQPGRRRVTAPATRKLKNGKPAARRALPIERVFSDAKVKAAAQLEWEKRTAEITDDANKVIFKQDNVEVPKSWSQLAAKVVVSKYFYG